MRTYKKVTETVTRELLDKVTCDLCGKEGKRKDNWDSSEWNVNETEIEVKIRRREGNNYPECGSGTKIVVDMCPECFINRLVPWLNSQGAGIKTEEWDW